MEDFKIWKYWHLVYEQTKISSRKWDTSYSLELGGTNGLPKPG